MKVYKLGPLVEPKHFTEPDPDVERVNLLERPTEAADDGRVIAHPP
jgi:hypothetical protein